MRLTKGSRAELFEKTAINFVFGIRLAFGYRLCTVVSADRDFLLILLDEMVIFKLFHVKWQLQALGINGTNSTCLVFLSLENWQ